MYRWVSKSMRLALTDKHLFAKFLMFAVGCAGLASPGYAADALRTHLNFTVVRVPQEQTTQKPHLADGRHSLKCGETQSYRIKLAAVQFLYATVEQEGIDVVVSVFGPDGSQFAVTDSPNDRWGTEPVLLVAATNGDYRIEIRYPDTKAAPGEYQIRMLALREATSTDQAYVASERT